MKNLNDLITFIVLIILVLISIRLFIFSLFKNEEDIPGYSRLELLRSYRDNEED